jgi:hypothetical protein
MFIFSLFVNLCILAYFPKADYVEMLYLHLPNCVFT